MRVLVTGGAGFIGSHIVDQLLAGGHEACVVDDLSSGRRENVPANVPFHHLDICDRPSLEAAVKEFRPEAISHQAAQVSVSHSVREPAHDARINVMGLLNVLDLAVEQGVRRVVFASSGGVLYGDVTAPAGEETPSAPISPYGISKWVGEHYLRFYARTHDLRCVALRYSNVYGPRQDPHGEAGVVAIFSQKLLAGQQATINGDGRYVRDYVYVEDVARANVRALESDLAELFVPFNVGTGEATDVNQLAEQVHELSRECRRRAGLTGEVPFPEHGPPRPGDLRCSLVDSSRAESLLGWKPRVLIGDGLRRTVEWFASSSLSAP